MHSLSKIKNTSKNLPFYSEEIKSFKKATKNLVILGFYLNYHFFLKKLKILLIINYQKSFNFFQEDQKDPEN